MNGYWVKVHDKMIYNDVWRFDPTAWRVFECLLVLAYPLDGEWHGGRKQLAAFCSQNDNTTYKALKRLQLKGMVSVSSNNKFSVFSICKWKEYQGFGNNQVTTQQQPGNNQVTTQQHSIKELELDKDIDIVIKPTANEKEKETKDMVQKSLDEYQKEFPKIDVPYEWEKCQLHFEETGKRTKDWRLRFKKWLMSEIPKKKLDNSKHGIVLDLTRSKS